MMLRCVTRRARGWACVISAGVCAAALSGCASVKTFPTVHTAKIKGQQTKQMATVHKGETLTVRLPTQTGSGYSWRLAPASADNGHLYLETRKQQQNLKGGLAKPNEAAWDIFVFNAKHTGQVPVEFFYDFSASPDTTPNRRFVLDVNVFKPTKDNPHPPTTSIASGENSSN